jgi:molybdopterin-guanine dinucleotide biosynthesis protein A
MNGDPMKKSSVRKLSQPRRAAPKYHRGRPAPDFTSGVYGLVLSGGKSTRMHTDKSLLNYHGKTQVKHCYELLQPYCDRVFLSNREDQSNLAGHKALPQIHDQKEYRDTGPLAGILSAMEKHPDVAWLVLACDLPYVNAKTLENLLEKRNPLKMATSYISRHDGLPEPLCAIYEKKSHKEILKFLRQGIICPRHILIHSEVELIKQNQKIALDNVNTAQEYRDALAIMNQKNPNLKKTSQRNKALRNSHA